jgi:hypothetical protein
MRVEEGQEMGAYLKGLWGFENVPNTLESPL